ncbi:CGNR zinc finger domain-containing protein [Micromonospora sp. A3M-1-15]|uniref:CGNR zinc finger domain-containing protein n=1 Tax=Micromonospora sp. A3M-1-15 TaxID=2962035 RepID=UPI0020B6D177|nr:CGNR zinc finger domain-containing protein [Micromonospora sp. A3M-1-15]MCP3785193.1 CGNR zinc finger domain-containing protein [Micromonospora sp. A3M-1-15]
MIQQLANSFDVRRGRDDLAGPGMPRAGFGRVACSAPQFALTAVDLARLHRLREVLRRMCLANNGAELHAAGIDALHALVRDSDMGPAFTVHGVGLDVLSSGAIGALGQIDGIVYEAIRDGTWGRVEACPEDACNYAFYDTSRNGSRVRCSMASCGSKVKMRAYRARAKADP